MPPPLQNDQQHAYRAESTDALAAWATALRVAQGADP